MPARQRLNVAAFNGACLFAGALGLLVSSPIVFYVALGVLVAGAVYAGDIRLTRSKRPSGRHRP